MKLTIILLHIVNLFATIDWITCTVPCSFNKLCSCSNTGNPIREVTCLNLPIPKIPSLPGVHIYRLNIHNSPDLQYLQDNSLGQSLISSLVIKKCRLTLISKSAFNGSQSTLTTLDLGYNELEDFPSNSLQGYNQLQWLSLKSNKLSNLKVKDWKNMFSPSPVSSDSQSEPSLRSLIISDNLLTSIPDLIFNHLISLRSLDLDNNRISCLDGKPFPSSLTSLSLANNLLEKFPNEALWNCNKLKWLTLRGNLITNLPNYWPLPLKSIDLIDLSHNQLTALDGNFFTHPTKIISPSRFRASLSPSSSSSSSTLTPYHQKYQLNKNQGNQGNHSWSKLGDVEVKRRGQRLIVSSESDDNSTTLQPTVNNNENVIIIREFLLDYNLIATINDDTFNSVIIERLSLANNYLSSLSDYLLISDLITSRLKVIDLSYNPFIGFPGYTIKSLRKLTNLLIRGNKISSLIDSLLTNCSQDIQMIDASSNQLQNVPANSLSHTKRLVKLNLAENLIINLRSDDLGSWSSKLLSLSLSKNGLQFISKDAFKYAINLRELRLAQNNLIYADGNFLIPLKSSLTILEFSYSFHGSSNYNYDNGYNTNNGNSVMIDELFNYIGTMSKLELLELDNNAINLRPSSQLFDNLHSLVHIDLEGNQLQQLPRNFVSGQRQTKLRNIIISNNQLKQISGHSFNSLGQVVTIDLRGNRLNDLAPSTFTNLPMLQTLVLTRNLINKINSRAIVNCSNLINLHLQENQLTFLDLSEFHDIWPTSDSSATNNNRSLINSFGININVSYNYIKYLTISSPELVNSTINLSKTSTSTSPQPVSTISSSSTSSPSSLFNQSDNISTESSTDQEISDDDILQQELSNNLPNDQPIKQNNKRLPIRSLDLSYNQLKELEPTITKAIGSYLVNLNLNHNRLTKFPVESLVHLRSLMSLSLSNNIISQLPELQLNDSLISSTLSSSSVYSSCCEKLIFLDLSQNNITSNILLSFERLFSSMVNLMILDLSYNHINTIQPYLLNGTLVSKLILSGNHLTSFSTSSQSSQHHHSYHHHANSRDNNNNNDWPCFGITSTLIHLDLSYNHFHSFPQEINRCSRLIYLNMKGNHLHELHDTLTSLSLLSSLRELDLSHNPINRIDSKKLNLQRQQQQQYNHHHHHHHHNSHSNPNQHHRSPIISLISLEILRLRNCSLTRIPNLSASRLSYLDLSSNRLHDIPSFSLTGTANIRHLNLSSNELPVVPEELGNLKALISLSLAGNPISNLDSSSFTPFKQLKTIDIRNLSLRYIDLRMFNSLKFLTELQTSTYPRVRSFRLADLLAKTLSLRSALIHVRESTLSHQIQWAFGPKLKELVITGNQLKKILPDSFLGLHHRPDLTLRIVDTNISSFPSGLLRYISDIRHMTIDLRRNKLTQFNLDVLQPNPAKVSPSSFHSNGVQISGGLLLEENPLTCACDIIWLGSWLRKWLKETRKVHLLNYESILAAESKARLMTCKYFNKANTRNISRLSVYDLRPKANLISIPILDLYPQDIGCNSCSTNLSSLVQMFLSTWLVYLLVTELS